MSSEFLSAKPTSEYHGNLTTHRSSLDVFPHEEYTAESAAMLAHVICGGDSPIVTDDKSKVHYFVASIYRGDVPFTEKTLPKALARGLGTYGKQRSRAHCPDSAVLNYEFDGVTDEQRSLVENRVAESGLQAHLFSSYSHGSSTPDKQGNRFRVVFFADVAQDHDDHEAAHEALGMELFENVPYDPSCKHIYQQQGCWATHPAWKHRAYKLTFKGGLVDSKKAAAAGYAMRPPKVPHYSSHRQIAPGEYTQRLEDALPYLNADDTSVWFSLMTAWKAAAPLLGEDNARELAVRYSEQGSDESKAKNDDARYDPATFFDNAVPTMGPEVGVATILANAKLNAFACLRQGLESGEVLTNLQLQAAFYCGMHHRLAYDALREDFGLGGAR